MKLQQTLLYVHVPVIIQKQACWLQRYSRYRVYSKDVMRQQRASMKRYCWLENSGRLKLVTVAEQADDLPESEKYTLRQTVVGGGGAADFLETGPAL
jgi:hypothetical protein